MTYVITPPNNSFKQSIYTQIPQHQKPSMTQHMVQSLQGNGIKINEMITGQAPYDQYTKDYSQNQFNSSTQFLLNKIVNDLYNNPNTSHLNLQA
jgi:hypothetical protein